MKTKAYNLEQKNLIIQSVAEKVSLKIDDVKECVKEVCIHNQYDLVPPILVNIDETKKLEKIQELLSQILRDKSFEKDFNPTKLKVALENFPTTVLQKMCASAILTTLKNLNKIEKLPLTEPTKNLLKNNIAISGSKRMSDSKICTDILGLQFFSPACFLDEASAESKKLKVL